MIDKFENYNKTRLINSIKNYPLYDEGNQRIIHHYASLLSDIPYRPLKSVYIPCSYINISCITL